MLPPSMIWRFPYNVMLPSYIIPLPPLEDANTLKEVSWIVWLEFPISTLLDNTVFLFDVKALFAIKSPDITAVPPIVASPSDCMIPPTTKLLPISKLLSIDTSPTTCKRDPNETSLLTKILPSAYEISLVFSSNDHTLGRFVNKDPSPMNRPAETSPTTCIFWFTEMSPMTCKLDPNETSLVTNTFPSAYEILFDDSSFSQVSVTERLVS